MANANLITGALCFVFGAVLAWILGIIQQRATFRRRLAEKRALLDGAAQQLRGPLNDVLGLVQTLSFRAGELGGETQELIGTIVGAGADAKSVLLDVFDILDMEFGRLKIKRSVELLPDIGAFLERTNERRLKATGVRLEVDVTVRARAWFFFDSLRFRQCVAAMVRQSVLQSRRGGVVKVSIDAVDLSKKKSMPRKGARKRRATDAFRKLAPKGERLIVATVRDASAGTEQHEADLYFSALDFSRNRMLMSAGASPLSLIVARMLARKMGGDVVAESASGKGVVFQLEAPAKFVRAAREEGERRLAPFEIASRLLQGKVVLAVDDSIVNLRILEAYLKRLGPKTILTAQDGEQALAALKQNPCNVVLMDVRMPVMDGLAAARRIRASNAAWRNIPIIAVSAAASLDERDLCIKAGMSGFVSKPVSAEELYERLAHVCAD